MKASTRRNGHGHHYGHYNLQRDFDKIKSALSDATFDVKGKTEEMLSQAIEDVKMKSHKAKKNLTDYTAEKPFKSLGIAALAGIIVGIFLIRR